MADSDHPPTTESGLRLPRVTIQFCTQCKWNLRAAYFAQELLQTFSTSLGEISLQPATGGVFKVDIYHPSSLSSSSSTSTSLSAPRVQHTLIWDRKTDGGFPETKELKRRVRDVIAPGRNLGHVDKDYGTTASANLEPAAVETAADQTEEGQHEPTHPEDAQHPLPRPGDIAARAHTLTHPPDAPQPAQREWGSRASDRRTPAGTGGTKPAVVVPEPETHSEEQGQKDEEMKIQDAEVSPRCEDCE